jgi:hypothetical protein
MAAGDWTWYGVGPNVDLSAGTYKVMLTTSTHTPNQDTHTTAPTSPTRSPARSTRPAASPSPSPAPTTGVERDPRRRVERGVGAGRDDHVPQRAPLQGNGGASSGDPLVAYIAYAADQSVSNGTLTISNASPTLKGTVAETRWELTTADPITVGTTGLTFVRKDWSEEPWATIYGPFGVSLAPAQAAVTTFLRGRPPRASSPRW